MERYKLKIFSIAYNDLREIAEYLYLKSPEASARYYDLIIEKIGTLINMPERCALVRDPKLRLQGYRMLIVKNYTVFFIVNGETVEIRRVLYSKRQYSDIL
ncbi:MAG: type II toxin-antitoxin system RelE/ParE family toxin [Oscillospiraceae bacterium]|nr:type II toxin-antitoxin system RelE/ParE family toxin [Oscillospiraceae bacterium]